MGTRKSLSTEPSPKQRLRVRAAWGSSLLTLLLLIGAVWVFWQQQHIAGQEYDLSRIGRGRPAVVQVHDPTCSACRQLQRSIAGLRDEFAEEIDFLVADLSEPEGQAFARTHGVGSVTLVFFDADGRSLGVLEGLQDSNYLLQVLQELQTSDQVQ